MDAMTSDERGVGCCMEPKQNTVRIARQQHKKPIFK